MSIASVPNPSYAPVSGTIVLASHNAGKLKEIRALLEPLGLQVIDAAAAGVDEPEETGTTFIENAELKARYSAERTGKCALSDDSGLVVPALGGAPGIYSARWAGPEKDFTMAMHRVHEELLQAGVEPRGVDAEFLCALSLAWPDGTCLSVEGKVQGTLRFPPAGTRGFGYDPIFVAAGMDETFAEIDPATKHAISHRADAFKQLCDALVEHHLLPTRKHA